MLDGWISAESRCPLVGLRGGWGLQVMNHTPLIMGTKSNNKRFHEDTDSDSNTDNDSAPTQNQTFARFLLIQATEEDKNLAKLSPFVIEKQLEGICGSVKSVKKLRNGKLLVEVERQQQAKNLLSLKTFFNIAAECVPHKTLNTSRGIIRCPDLADVPEEEIVSELSAQHVTAAKRIKTRRNGEEIQTNTIILTFGTSILPKTIKVGYLITKVDVYIPNPLQCYECFKFGHHEKTCKSESRCHNCAGNGDSHPQDDCKYERKCVNCGEPHSAKSRQCKQYKIEREVLRIRFTQNIGFPEARKLANLKFAPPSAQYASIVKSGSSKSVELKDAQTQTLESSFSSKPVESLSSPSTANIQQNIPRYTSMSAESQTKSSSPTKTASARTTPKQRIDTGRVKKGSRDPILSANRYEALSDMEEENENFSLPPVTPTSSKEQKIKRISAPDSMDT